MTPSQTLDPFIPFLIEYIPAMEREEPKPRKPHVLTANKRFEAPRYMVFFDSESRPNPETMEHEPYLICASFLDRERGIRKERDYIGANKIWQFWTEVAAYGGSKWKKLYVYAHNAGYDTIATAGIPALLKHDFEVTSFFEKGTVFIMEFQRYVMIRDPDGKADKKRVEKTVTIISSMNYFSESLARLATTFNMAKLDFDVMDGSEEDALPYCRQDTNILEKAVMEFTDFVIKEDLGTLAKTVAGQAFNAYRHRFMREPIYIHTHEEAIKLERQAYSGGRVECFRIGRYEGHFSYFDVNSMYPFVMRDERFPVKFISYRKHSSLEHLMSVIYAQDLLAIARVRVRVDKPVLQCQVEGFMLFPVGEFWTTLSTPELRYALDRGLVQEVAEVAMYEGARIFEGYVSELYALRMEAKAKGNAVYEKMYKLMLNSLYGKFGQKAEEWLRIGKAPRDIVQVFDHYDEATKEMKSYKVFGGSMFEKQGEGEAFNSFPAVAAHVTAYARMLILELIESAGWGHVLYTDTDSVFVDQIGRDRLQKYVNEKELGKIKLEKESDYIEIFAPKDYKFADLFRRKGVNKKDAVQLADDTFQVTQWLKLNSFIREGQLSTYRNVERVKVLTRAYTKGWVLNSGEVRPLETFTEGRETRLKILGPEYQLRQFKIKKEGGYTAADQREHIKKKYKAIIAQ